MLYFENNIGIYYGKLLNNKLHSHYAIQISISLNKDLVVDLGREKKVTVNAFFVNTCITHKLFCEQNHLSILVNPICSLGYALQYYFDNSSWVCTENILFNELIGHLKKFQRHELEFPELAQLIIQELLGYKQHESELGFLKDDRIKEAILFIDANYDRIVSLKEIASHCYLSQTRFLHLFKEKTNISFRRYQLWNKVVKSLPHLVKNSIKETAYAFGFSNAGHYTRTFNEMFGVTPKFFRP